jgi:hypothetical protein
MQPFFPEEDISGVEDEPYFLLLASAIQASAAYKPAFGQGKKGGVTLEQFQQMYQADPFYRWVGLDSPLMYAAHKAAGGMTSIYRQLGIGCEAIFRRLLRDRFNLTASQVRWDYSVPTPDGKGRSLALDGRIEFSHIQDPSARERVIQWVEEAEDKLLLGPEIRQTVKGAVFEVRQGYKSKDSKRQNADISNAVSAYTNGYLPVLVVLSTQIDADLAQRYIRHRWLLLTGTTTGQSTDSTYVFCRHIIGYDLAAFFHRNSDRIKAEIERVLATLLKA